jgi:UDP-sulfoquinovose synthase
MATVLNRFIVQAVIGFPLTVYGNGGQTRGYLNIKDTMACVELALLNPANRDQYRVFNQFVETSSVNELAEKVQEGGKELGLKVKINKIPNPHREAEEHYYNPSHTGLLELGLQPHYLTNEILTEMGRLVVKHRPQINLDQIVPKVKWNETCSNFTDSSHQALPYGEI